MEFATEVTGMEAVRTRMLRFENVAVHMEPVLQRIAMRIEGEIEKQFATEGAHAGSKWAPLAKTTLARKKALGFPSDILVATGDLKRSWRKGGIGNIFDVTPDMVRVGSLDKKTKFHQKGTSKMPARPMAVLTPQFRREAVKRMQWWIVEGKLK